MNLCNSSKGLSIFVCLCMCSHLYYCQIINDTYNLLNDKLANYNRKIRPTFNQSAPTEVKFGFQLVAISEFDELQEKLSVVGVIHLNWVDEMIQWNPLDYGGMYTVLTESGSFWIPNLVLTNTATKLDKIGDDWQSIRYVYNGSAYYYPLGIYTSSCSADITLYPWDIHYCVLNFTPQGHISSEMTIQTMGNKIIKDHYIENGAWTLLASKVQSSYISGYMSVDVEIVFERKPRYALVNVVLPIVFLAFLSNVVFLIPTDSGERVSYAITMLLAMAVFLTLVGDNLPKTSSPMSYLSYYLMTLLAVNICVSMATIFNLRIHHNDESVPVTGCWTKLPAYMKIACRSKEVTNKNGEDLHDQKVNNSMKVVCNSKAEMQAFDS
ncbi:neuronal acetylcholine receptor subunit alpha-7-like [Mercenaria mercenaria]|uniref:neuronal acetylcholine receptor subunit alpha-7-like n=1 Tax=Mercenaria mercenaria TaxID=6596 RepID=UPI00234EA5C4|nr:neuronal acetylcholine receptor subunit alpha-7-like [Mercenaria mercenaria]